jgi:trk system potassium uptake protein TrkA
MMRRRNSDKEYAVIGLGRFGSSVALTLVERGYRVLGVDTSREVVQHYADELTHTVALDASNEEALSAIDIGSFDTVIVSMAEHFENSILATVALKKLGVRCVICKALSERQAEIFVQVGADRVILPEKEAGQRLALELIMPEMLDSMVLGPGYSVAEVQLPDWLQGKSMAESKLRDRFGVNVLVVKCGETLIVSPPSTYVFQAGDVLVVIGSATAISRLADAR